MKNFKITLYIAIIAIITFTVSCSEESLEPTLAQEKNYDFDETIDNVEDLNGIMLGAFNRMTNSTYYGRDYVILGEVRTDNVFSNANSGRFVDEGRFGILSSFAVARDTWSQMYSVIASANIVIQEDESTLKGDPDEIAHIKGEAYAIRALAHFDLLKLFGQQHVNGGNGSSLGVPYITSYEVGNFPPRNTVDQVKDAIIDDLTTAKTLLNSTDGLGQEIGIAFPDALLSRVYLYFGMWPEARDAAKAVIDLTSYSIMSKDRYVASFATDGTNNTIFALANSDTDNAGINSLGFIYRGPVYGDIQVLQNAADIFEVGDVRGFGGILGMEGSKIRNLGKFPETQGYDDTNIIRYEEIILNYAEALWRINNLDTNALDTFNLITVERGASELTTLSEDIILNERRKELMFEGFRFDDLMRTGRDIEKIDTKQGFSSTILYGDYRLAFPIPIAEMDANSSMVQNDGYY